MSERSCEFCFDYFDANVPWQRFCSPICREEQTAGERRQKVFDPRDAVRICKCCRENFVVGNPRALFCSPACRHEFHAELRKQSGRGAESSQRWRENNPSAHARSLRKRGKKMYKKLKQDKAAHAEWRAVMAQYRDPEKRRASQRKRMSAAALSAILLPTKSGMEE